jgi:hypothetical protein
VFSLALLACGGTPTGDTGSEALPVLGATVQTVPTAMPSGLAVNEANNNLHVTEFEGRLWMAFRTADSHFAGPEVLLHVVSTDDEVTWQAEGSFSLETDLREPHLVSWQGTLRLYFAVLGDNPFDFEPQGMRVSTWLGPDSWTEPQDVFADEFPEGDFLVWRIKELDGVLYATGYTGGGNIYDVNGEPLVVHWLRSEDGLAWVPAVGDESAVQTGGGSETDFAFLDDGSLVAVTRNEAGDSTGWGSNICTAPAEDLGDWTCENDPRKYDSPLVFRQGDHIWLVARRNLTEDGHYDLGMDDLDVATQTLRYQADYWQRGKRCAIWRVQAHDRSVHWVADLPSNGDTCFPSRATFGGRDGLYNYSNDPEGFDLAWLEGQHEPTGIYRTEINWP